MPKTDSQSICKRSIDSSSEEHDDPHDSEGAFIHLSESSKVVINLSSSDNDDGRCSSEDEQEDESNDSDDEEGDESCSSEHEDADEINASDDEEGDESCSSEHEDTDESDGSDDEESDESCSSEYENADEGDDPDDNNRRGTKSISSTPAGKILTADVAKLIKGGDLKNLKVDDCRAYLRKYKLRIAGPKPVLIDRIKQYIELRKSGSRGYPRSTFTINCTGDVCKGDVVMFEQNKVKKFSAITKNGLKAGKRIVAGRVVKESYGAKRQQHTFTVEVLWSTGFCPLAPMKQLLVKGRNLYKRRIYRQRWADEGERQRSLDEKHIRGAAAREIRAMKQRIFHGGYAPARLGQPSTVSNKRASADQNRPIYPRPRVLTSFKRSGPLAQVSKTNKRSCLVEGSNSTQSRRSPKRPPVTNVAAPRTPKWPLVTKFTVPRTPKRPPVTKVAVPRIGFPCPTKLCKNTGSGKCSSGVCYPCCKTKGRACRHPSHKKPG